MINDKGAYNMEEENKIKQENKVEEELSPIDRLFDENDVSPISLFDEKGEEVKFEQIAIIPLEEEVYAILKPMTQMEGVGEDEALVFQVVEEEDEDGNNDDHLDLVADIDVIDKVFDVYNKLMDEEEAKSKAGKK